MNKYEKLAEKGCSKRDLWMRYFTEMTEKTRKFIIFAITDNNAIIIFDTR